PVPLGTVLPLLTSPASRFLATTGSRVWREVGTRHDRRNIRLVVQGGDGSVMVWGAMTGFGVDPLAVVNGTLNPDGYVDLLATAANLWFSRAAEEHLWALFRAPFHTAHYTKWWLETHNMP
ncbi:ATP-binding cassette transporter snq2, partial [Sorochytrium milnesiophthora]